MKPPADAIAAWHFLPANGRTQYSNELVTVGSILHVPGEIEICDRGLHASRRAIDALQYAPGPIVCKVLVWVAVQEQSDKLVGAYRQCVSMGDATNTLHEFACYVAEAALLIAEVKDQRCWNAIEAKRAWMRGEINDAQLDAATAAAWAEQNKTLEFMLRSVCK